MDHQGKIMRYLWAKGLPTVVLTAGEFGRHAVVVSEDLLLAFGTRVACLCDGASGRMDDELAAKLFSGKNALLLRK
jgi:hypothetical protein